jgi:predicted  nucleic acid-binding Zn-ribbon protein
MITTSKNEVEFLNASLQSKNEEINKLNETIGKLSVKIQEIQEENIVLRSQMSSQFQDFMTVKTDSSKNTKTVTKPKVLLLGTSNTKGINEDTL